MTVSTTDKVRIWVMSLFTIVVFGAIAGWLFFDKTPNDIAFLLGTLATALGIGEASNIGKRATFKKEASE